VFVYGLDRAHTVALIVPDFVELTLWVEAHKDRDAKDLVALLPSKEQLADTSVTASDNLFKHEAFQRLISSEVCDLYYL
jgi:long-subunit acyl-CoA synthetase (AMP-forming)